jgi:fibronectin type 3 domain-containing protein
MKLKFRSCLAFTLCVVMVFSLTSANKNYISAGAETSPQETGAPTDVPAEPSAQPTSTSAPESPGIPTDAPTVTTEASATPETISSPAPEQPTMEPTIAPEGSTFENAIVLTTGKAVHGEITAEASVIYYTVTVAISGEYEFLSGGNLPVKAVLYDADNNKMDTFKPNVEIDGQDPKYLRSIITLTRDTVYYLTIQSNESGHAGTFDLLFSKAEATVTDAPLELTAAPSTESAAPPTDSIAEAPFAESTATSTPELAAPAATDMPIEKVPEYVRTPFFSIITCEQYGSNGARITWVPVINATGYNLYRSTSINGTYSYVKAVTGATADDARLTAGLTYYYKVRSYTIGNNVKYYNNYSDPKSVQLLSIPVITSATPAGDNVVAIQWAAVTNADGYDLYRSGTKSGIYKLVKSVTTNSAYDEGLAVNVKYYYKIKAYRIYTDKVFSPMSVLSTMVSIPAPIIRSVQQSSAVSAKITWSGMRGATGYELCRAANAEGPYIYQGTTTMLSLENTVPAAGQVYYYIVRSYSISGDSTLYSAYSNYQSVQIMATPVILSANVSNRTVYVTWAKVAGATGYVLYRSTAADGDYTLLKTLTTCSYTDSALSGEIGYYYKVKAYRLYQTKVFSALSDASKVAQMQAPSIQDVQQSGTNSATIKWTGVTGASGYQVYRSTSANGIFTNIQSITGTSYTNSSLPAGQTFYYKVRCFITISKSTAYSIYSNTVAVQMLATPILARLEAAGSTSVLIKWDNVTNAVGYRVLRANSLNGSYSAVSTVLGLSYTDTNLQQGSSYYYKVDAYRQYGSTVVYSPQSSAEMIAVALAATSTPGPLPTAAATGTPAPASTPSRTPVIDPTGALVISSVIADKQYAYLGETIVWVVNAVGEKAPLKYKFELVQGETILVTHDFSDDNTFSYSTAATGVYAVNAIVQDSEGHTVSCFSASSTVVNEPSIESVNADKTCVYMDETVTWTAIAKGGKGPLQYLFELYKGDIKQAEQSYSNVNVYVYRPTEAGNYSVKVSVKDSEIEKTFTSTPLELILEPYTPALCFTFTNVSNRISITGYTGAYADVAIPKTIAGVSVYSIGMNAFYGTTALTRVTIPEGVKEIGENAFAGCTGLVSVSMPAGLLTIGKSAFQYCNLLNALIIPDSVTTIGSYAFADCALLRDIVFPSGIKSIGDKVFGSSPANISINVKSFGAMGDGSTDDTLAIQNAINYAGLNGYNIICEKSKIYIVATNSGDQDVIKIKSNNTTLNLNGSTFRLAPNKYTYYSLIKVTQKTGVKIMNGVLQGDRLTHDYTTISSTHEFGYGVSISGSQVTLDGLEIYDMTGDAVCAKEVSLGGGAYTTGTARLLNCELHHCRRQGISVLDFGYVYVTGCYIHHIGTFNGINGASPMSGIDLEPAYGTEQIKYVELNNTRITNVSNLGIVGSHSTLDVKITGLYVDSPCIIDFTSCNIYDSTFDYKYLNLWCMVLRPTNIYNSRLISSINNKVIYVGGTWTNCYIEGSSAVLGNSTRLSGTYTLTGCEIWDLCGLSAQGKGGILIDGYDIPTLNNNVFNNSSLLFVIDGAVVNSGNVFNSCNIYAESIFRVTFNKCSFNNCIISSNIKTTV